MLTTRLQGRNLSGKVDSTPGYCQHTPHFRNIATENSKITDLYFNKPRFNSGID